MGAMVKGSLVIDYVRMIRSIKSVDWEKWLDHENLDAIQEEIVTSAWYPYKLFRQLAWACFQGIAKGDFNMASTFGRFNMKNLLPVYRKVLVPDDPKTSVSNFVRFWGNFFQGEGMELVLKELSETQAAFEIKPPQEEQNPDRVEAFAHQLGGMLIELVENAGSIKAKIEVATQGLTTLITVRWG